MATKKTAKAPAAKKSKVVISGKGLSFSVLDIDAETFKRFTQTGIPQDEFDDLQDQLDDADCFITAPFLESTTVSIDGETYRSSWDVIKGQCGGKLPAPYLVYEAPAGTSSVIFELIHSGDFARAEIKDFDPAKLRFDLEHVSMAKGHNHVMLDPYYNGKPLDWGETTAEGAIYVVDNKGKRYEIVRAKAG